MATFDEYIANPMGGSVFTQREMYKTLYTQKFDAILMREAGKIVYNCYKAKNAYIIHIKIPSEVVPKFYYDVVVEFTPIDITAKVKSLNTGYNVRFFSNDPAFVYTFAHAFIEHDLFFKDCISKMSKLAVKRVAVEKNPNNQIGYVKSLYFAYIFMKRSGLFSLVKFDAESKKYSKNALVSTITHADSKIVDRQRRGEEEAKSKRIEKQRERSLEKAKAEYKPSENIIQPRKITKTKTSSTVKRTKNSKKI